MKHLSAEEVREMTGASTPGRQLAWLARHHVPCYFNGVRVIVERSVAEAHHALGEMADSGPRMDMVR